MAISLMTRASIPSRLWSYAFSASVFLINRLPSSSLGNKSPFEYLFNRLPDYSHLKTFGCTFYSFLKPYNSNKRQPKTSQCVFLDYPLDYKGYLCYNMSTNKLYTSRHVRFDKHLFPFSSFFPPSLHPSFSSTPSVSSLPLLLSTLFSSSTSPTNSVAATDLISPICLILLTYYPCPY